MAITEASDRMGSAGLTNRNKQSCGNIFFFLRRGEKNIREPTVGRNASENSENKQVLQLLFVETCSSI